MIYYCFSQFRLGEAPNYDLNFFKHTEANLYTFTWLGQRKLILNCWQIS